MLILAIVTGIGFAVVRDRYTFSLQSPIRIQLQWPLVVTAKTGGDDAIEARADQFGRRLTAYQQYACNKFGSACRVALAIQRAENPRGACEIYHYNTDGTLDWGYFQINTVHLKRAGVNNRANGANGLPVIVGNGGPLTIIGNGDTIERSTAKNTPAFRLFWVQSGATLTLENLTLQGGNAGAISNWGTLTMSNVTVQNNTGGGIYNTGTLTMSGVTVQKNTAQGAAGPSFGPDAAGGGIYSSGSLMLQDCLIQNNQALGGDGFDGGKYRAVDASHGWEYFEPTSGGWAYGGGVYVAGGTAEFLGTTVTHNTAKGGRGGRGIFVFPTAPDGRGVAGGVYIASQAAVVLDAFTVAHVVANTADIAPDIGRTFSVS